MQPQKKETIMFTRRASSVLVIGIALLFAREAAAVVPVGPPSPGAFTVRVGTISNNPYAVYIASGVCFFYDLGDSLGLDNDYEVRGGSSADNIVNISASQTISCVNTGFTYTITPINYHGHFLDLNGMEGNDEVINFTSGNTYVYGFTGNDNVVNFSPGTVANGDDGDDRVYNLGSGTNDHLTGGGGTDCLFDANGAASTFDCGPEMFDLKASPVPVNQTNCDIPVSSCS
jgi:hypothetical protein